MIDLTDFKEKALFIIGNGFDIAHGIKSSYNDYHDWLLRHQYHEFVAYMESLFPAIENGEQLLWKDFEEAIGIYDTMKYIKCDVSTICVGMAASMGAFLLAGGTKGKRYALPNSEIMIHQPLGGTKGQATDIKIHADHIIRTRARLNQMLSEATGKPLEIIEQDTERDNFLSAQEALDYGLIDHIMESR